MLLSKKKQMFDGLIPPAYYINAIRDAKVTDRHLFPALNKPKPKKVKKK
jgi:hypothetical protein